ncbi:peptide chain release factor N(5)-glutamine methyltransferase [Candidatus Babeliales bacterium]|nr:peptide chain release factor N(5)-glutamine methyltransferase [Candidatus Babeliales bacterium]
MNPVIDYITQNSSLSSQEAWWLLEHVTKKSQTELILSFNLNPNEQKDLDRYLELIQHHHKPLAYIIGWVPFLNLKINVSEPILIPRPETEEWVQKLIESLVPQQAQISRILDIGTGSGCIALALAKSLPKSQILAIDINPQALRLAQNNAVLNNVKNIEFIQSDLFKQLGDQKFDLIVSNPPYIPAHNKQSMTQSVLQWEDHGALFADSDGLSIIRALLKQASDHLTNQPALPYQLVFEIDYSQKNDVLKLAEHSHWSCTIQPDLYGNDRTAWCAKKVPVLPSTFKNT